MSSVREPAAAVSGGVGDVTAVGSARNSALLSLAVVVSIRIILGVWAAVVPQFHPPAEPADVIGSPYLGEVRIDEGIAGTLLGPWQRFDTQRYVRIAREGYVAPDDSVFPPLYPMLIRLGAAPFGGGAKARMFAALAAATLAAFGLFFMFHRLAVLEIGEARARNAVLFLAFCPTGFFLFAGYSESLFIFLALASFVAARDGHFGRAGIIGALSSLTRLTGWCLALPIAWEAYVRWNASRKSASNAVDRREDRRLVLHLAAAALPIVATAAFLLFRRNAGFPPLGETYALHWGRTPGIPGQDLVTAAGTLFFGGAARLGQLPILWVDFVSAVLMLVATPFVFRRFGISYGLYMAAILFFLLLATSSVLPLHSVARYVLPLFPAFFLFGMATADRPILQRVLLIPSFSLWLLFSALFFSRNWVG